MTRLAFLTVEQEHVPLTKQSLSKGQIRVKMGIYRFVVRLGILSLKGKPMVARIESFLSSRLLIFPQLVGDRLYFLSNLSGQLSLYAMSYGGSVPEPLLPSNLALQNPELIGGFSFYVFPKEIGRK